MIELFSDRSAMRALQQRVAALAKSRTAKGAYDYFHSNDGQRILIEGKWRQLRHGVDNLHQPYAPLARSTIKRRHERRVKDWPPLIAWNERFITCLQVGISYRGIDAVDVWYYWAEPGRKQKGAPIQDFWRFHRDGTPTMPARNPCGLDIDTLEAIRRDLELSKIMQRQK